MRGRRARIVATGLLALGLGAGSGLGVGAAVQAAGPGPDGFMGPARMSIRGAGASETEAGDYGLGVWARTTGAPEEAEGQFRFGHRGADGERGYAGEVHCLSRDAAGLVQVSGRVFGSGGEDAAGQDFAATVDVDGSPQRFSDVRLGDPGTIAPCSGGGPGFHPVTRGGYDAAAGDRPGA